MGKGYMVLEGGRVKCGKRGSALGEEKGRIMVGKRDKGRKGEEFWVTKRGGLWAGNGGRVKVGIRGRVKVGKRGKG